MSTRIIQRLVSAAALALGIGSCAGVSDAPILWWCDGGTTLSVTYNTDRSAMTVEDGEAVSLIAARSASGARYVGEGTEYWEKAGQVRWTRAGKPTITCTRPAETKPVGAVGIANPASVHCAEVGGRTVIETLPNGSEFGVCLFTDNRQCGEWALFRGECPVGGMRVAGYPSDAARYCAITGATYSVKEGQETCTTQSGETCDLDAYFNGSCR